MHQSTHDVYDDNQKALKKGRENKKLIPSSNWPNQLMKSTMGINLSLINSLVQVNKLHKNKYFNLWIESSTFSKDLFLSFQIVQKMHKGAALQTCFRFLPTKEPC